MVGLIVLNNTTRSHFCYAFQSAYHSGGTDHVQAHVMMLQALIQMHRVFYFSFAACLIDDYIEGLLINASESKAESVKRMAAYRLM